MISDLSPTFVGTTTFRVEGMTCDHCRHAVTAEICAVPGVEGVRDDLPTGTVSVSAAQPINRTDIAAAVDEAGYTLVA